MRRRTIALVTGHFPPSNLVGVHRVRLWAQHVHEFGWDPVVVTTHHRHYEEALDFELAGLVDPGLRVVRTGALPVKPVRVVGDIGLRGLPFHLAALRKLAREGLDFALITLPANHSALLGRLLKASHGVPYGLDYMDPWVPYVQKRFPVHSKHHWVRKVAPALERWAVRDASLLTAVSKATLTGVLERNPAVAARVVTADMPLGNSAADYATVGEDLEKLFLFDPRDGKFHLTYAGGMTHKIFQTLDILLRALVLIRAHHPAIAERLRLHFVGTGTSPSDPKGFNIKPHADGYGLGEMVHEHPHRIGFVDVLRHLKQSSAVLVLGSMEAHYTPSKVYQSIQSRRPLFALLNGASPAVAAVEATGAGTVVPLQEGALPDPAAVADTLVRFVTDPGYDAASVDWAAFEAFSARASAKAMIEAVERALERAA